MSLEAAPGTVPDLLRLVAVPVFAWAAVRDVKTRRITSAVWIPLGALGAALLVWDARVAASAGGTAWTAEFLIPAAISLGFVVPLAFLFWWIGGFGGADAKALMVLALLFPVVPAYTIGGTAFPGTGAGEGIGAFSLTILTNAVLVGLAIPVALAVRNAAAGRFTAAMAVGWPVATERVVESHGRLLETPKGRTRNGLDLDALRMYLRWRGLGLAELRADPARYRDPATLPEEPNPPTDGAVGVTVGTDDVVADGGDVQAAGSDASGGDEHDEAARIENPTAGADRQSDDPWGAEAFLEDIEGSAYGTSPDQLRDGLEVLAENETVWISPGTPFLVPVFLGLLIALVYGDLLLGLLF